MEGGSQMQNALEIRNLSKRYEGFALQQVNLQIPAGRIVGLIGENGAGKSTLMKAALNLIRRDEGEILFWGQPLTEEAMQLKEEIGVVFDGMNFYETLTPEKMGKICRAAYRNWDMAAYRAYLERFMLPLKKEIRTFSKGMQVKLCLAVAMSHRAKLLILDEPTSGLDPVIRDDILDIFLEFVQEEDHSIILSSHITTDLEKIADYIVFLHQGKVILSENKDEMIYRYGVLRCSQSQYEKIAKEDIMSARQAGYQWNVLVADREKAQRKYPDMIVDKATLEEIMLLYVKAKEA